MTDYAALIDGPTWAFIRASEAAYPPDAATLTIAAQRAIHDTMCCAFFQGSPPGITARDAPVSGVPCRTYPGQGGRRRWIAMTMSAPKSRP